MLRSYFENMNVGMTKDSYFELCEALGNEPLEEEIPVEYDDFPVEVQEAIGIYYKLRDEWDGMNGVYMGKSFAGFADILNIMEYPEEDRKYLLDWIAIMDATRSKMYKDMKPKDKPKPEAL